MGDPEDSEVIDVDQTSWPVVTTSFSGRITMDELEAYFATLDEVLARGERSVGLVVVRDIRPWDSAMIQRTAAWRKDNEAVLRRASLGVALVLPSLWLKGILRAVLWLHPVAHPLFIASTVGEARAWIADVLRGAGMDAPARTTPEPAASP